MVRLFGTDGVRGVAGEDLTGQLAMDVARAAASVLHHTGAFAAAEESGGRPLAVVGRDPRASGEVLEAAVVGGLAGFKLPDAVEDEIEAHLGMPTRRRSDLPAGFGRVSDATTEPDRYLEHLLASVTANGASA